MTFEELGIINPDEKEKEANECVLCGAPINGDKLYCAECDEYAERGAILEQKRIEAEMKGLTPKW